jgi:hypothetical protein
MTDPYRPPVRATPTDDAPFVVKSTEELPSKGKDEDEENESRELLRDSGAESPRQTHM